MTDEDDIYDDRYASQAEAIAAAQAVSKPGDIIQVHDAECEIDDNEDGCTCEPVVLVCVELPRA